jgi:hypothetical protein
VSGSLRSSQLKAVFLATGVAVIAGGLSLYFLVTDICLDAGGRVVDRGIGCEIAEVNATFVLVPPGVLVLCGLIAGGTGVAAFVGARRWARRAAG